MRPTFTLPVTVTIHYPTDLATLTRWSHALFVAYYLCGLTGAALFFGPIILAFMGHSLWLLTAMPFGGLLSYAVHGLQHLMAEVDSRRYDLIFAAQDTDQ